MSHYGIIQVYAHFFMVMVLYILTTECMVLSMYVTLRIYGMVPMHVTLYGYGMVPKVTLYGMVATNSCHTITLCQYVTLWYEANLCHRYKIRHM